MLWLSVIDPCMCCGYQYFTRLHVVVTSILPVYMLWLQYLTRVHVVGAVFDPCTCYGCYIWPVYMLWLQYLTRLHAVVAIFDPCTCCGCSIWPVYMLWLPVFDPCTCYGCYIWPVYMLWLHYLTRVHVVVASIWPVYMLWLQYLTCLHVMVAIFAPCTCCGCSVYKYKFKKVTWLPLRVRPSRPAWVCLCHRAASFTYFGEVLRCPHKRIVTITKVYTVHRRNNIHVELTRFRKQ